MDNNSNNNLNQNINNDINSGNNFETNNTDALNNLSNSVLENNANINFENNATNINQNELEYIIQNNNKVRRSPIVPIILSIILILVAIPSIKDMLFSATKSGYLSGFEFLGHAVLVIIELEILKLIWIIYLLILTFAKKKNKEKKWWIPLIITCLIIIVPKVIDSIYLIVSELDSNSQLLTNVEPEIKAYDKLSDIPVYEDYAILGEDINEYDVYNNIDKYTNTKVLVKGIPSYMNDSGSSYGDTVNVNIYNQNNEDRLLYRFTFVDKKSEFHDDDYIFFATKDTNLEDYYTYIYGEIVDVQNVSNSGNDYKIINIQPEKIYYTLKWDTMYIEEEEIIYSTCAKVGNRCSDDQILDGQIVNVSVNDSTNLNFYVINDDGQNLVLYGYEALTLTPYLSENDTKKLLNDYGEKRNQYDDSNDYFMYNYWGPYTLIKKLNELTSDWTNIPEIKDYSYNSTGDYIFKNYEIKNGVSSITSYEGHSITIPGKSVARIISEDEIIQEDNLPKFYSMPCLRTMGIRENSKCYSWAMDTDDEDSVIAIYSEYEDDNYINNIIPENIHGKNYLVPVIEVPKTLINNK